MSIYAKEGLMDYINEETAVHPGGIKGRAFWNIHSTQFMYNPCFQFPKAPGYKKYLFTVTDTNKKVHTFEADKPTAFLTPVWGDIPEGITELKVEALDLNGNKKCLVGARTFYKSSPFPGIEHYPEKARSYRECALMAYRYVFNQPFIQYWLNHSEPDIEYDFNVYPSKTISRIIEGMIEYSALEPDKKEDALRIATNAADFLISITHSDNSPVKGLPPTYYTKFRENIKGRPLDSFNNESGVKRAGSLMMIYPATVGVAYLKLEEVTGDKKYFDAASKIGEYFIKNVLPNGSWYLFISEKTGKPIAKNSCTEEIVTKFLSAMYKRTNQKIWEELKEGYHKFIVKNCLETYNWEGQFEDSEISSNYSNLSHYPALSMMDYILENESDNLEMMLEAEDLLRFAEDQFVVWGNFAPWNEKLSPKHGENIDEFFSPAALEQYGWMFPIDASTARIMRAFLDMYKVKKKPVLLEKAKVLADMITRMQNEKTGLIPTHWMRKTCIEDGGNLWINCMLTTAKSMKYIADFTE